MGSALEAWDALAKMKLVQQIKEKGALGVEVRTLMLKRSLASLG
jgi:hypothetical protein